MPTTFYKSSKILEENIKTHKPDYIVSIGQAGGRDCITPERVSININDSRIPDNENNQPIDEKIRQDGESAYFSTLPVKAIVKRLNNEGINSNLSNTAGTFVCNYIMYEGLFLCEKYSKNTKSGFIHIPYIKEQVKENQKPYMDLEEIIKGITFAIEEIISFHNKKDIKEIMGKTH